MLNNAVNMEIVEKIKLIDRELLIAALTDAVVSGYVFPQPIIHFIGFLQKDYLANKDPKTVVFIKERISEKFPEIFPLLTAPNFLESEWGEGFCMFLVRKLNITLERDSLMVEAFLRNAKIHWRIIKNLTKEVVYASPQWFEGQEPRFLITWERFQELKNAGKRSGSVRLTQHLFVQQFNFYLRPFAIYAWFDLQTKGVLTPKNRLSESWRIITNKEILLNTVTVYYVSIKWIFTDMQNLVNAGILPNKDVFIMRSIPFYQPHAGLIWDEYSKNGFRLTKTAIKKILKRSEFCFDYTTIGNAMYAVINNPHNQGHLPHLTFGKFFRAERTVKTWQNTGRVIYSHLNGTETQLLDVAVYQDASTHKASALYGQLKVERDHLPSFGIYHWCAEYFLEIQKHVETIAPQLTEECRGEKHGLYWWTLAIPHLLHVEGATHGKKINQQLQELSGENAFLRDIRTYLNFIESVPEKASTTFFIKSYLELLGALRHLYHSQVKYHGQLDGKFYVGIVPWLFFSHRNENNKIDAFFTDKISNHLNQKGQNYGK